MGARPVLDGVSVSALESLLVRLDATDRQTIEEVIAPRMGAVWRPKFENRPQCEAYYSQADLLLYGGGAGGGKTDLLIGLACTSHELSVIFRRQAVELLAVENRLLQIMGRNGWNGQDRIYRSGERMIELGHLERPGAELSWQGRPHDFIGFDEGAQLQRHKVQFVLGWLRSTRPGQRRRAVIASNPPEGAQGAWLTEWFAPWVDPLFINPAKYGELRWAAAAPNEEGTTIWLTSGAPIIFERDIEWRLATPEEIARRDERVVQPLTRTFIQSLLENNPFLAETGYRAQIQSMPEPWRSRLLHGDWQAGRSDALRQVIPLRWVEAANERWRVSGGKPKSKMLCVGVDVAQGGSNETVLAPLHGNWFGELTKRRGIDTLDGPAVAGEVMQVMRDGALIAIDITGGWGGSARDHLMQIKHLEVSGIVASGASRRMTKDGKLYFYNKRSEMWWKFREALDPQYGDDIALPPDRRLTAQLCAPTWKTRGDKILIESKDEVMKRLGGASTDDADAVIMAWSEREAAIERSKPVAVDPVDAGPSHPQSWMGM
jgi:hypothetical protein